MKNFKITFFFLQLPIAISLLGHGLVRLPKLTAFAEGMVSSMESSVLPSGLVLAFGYILPVVEAVLGAALLIGFQTRYILYGALALMGVLVLGSSTIENWGAVQAQLVHGIYLGFLLWFYEQYRNENK
ncbi:DoxX family protein [Parapedobacter sp. SGR-10]|uniref:MauE/DoxX family redox-associated membrane protein n=1 Tax=Parapedobacter sp. SGR-10 TaxID=2710879 RepID=UPI0013D6233B|nr:MauE/DoxX family redox-associated membrane protein [Parapedobacter sp. SGR-10]NGF55483.1 DoxX family protein [Parapedobacter sp. SGR-10]